MTLPSTKGNTVNTFTPNVVTTDETSPFDTSKGTVYLTLGGGGTNKRDNAYGNKIANVTTFTQVRTGAKPTPDATEPCNWSAKTDTTDAYGVALFSVDPGNTAGGATTITVTYYHAPSQTETATGSPGPNYSLYESFQLTRPRSDSIPPVVPELPAPALAVGGTLALAAGALVVQQRRRAAAAARLLEQGVAVVPLAGDRFN